MVVGDQPEIALLTFTTIILAIKKLWKMFGGRIRSFFGRQLDRGFEDAARDSAILADFPDSPMAHEIRERRRRDREEVNMFLHLH
jgi:hypothetical protein